MLLMENFVGYIKRTNTKLTRKKGYKAISTPTAFTGDPPSPIDTPKEFGSYCMRATSTLLDSDGTLVRKYIGYGTELAILDKVENVCKFDQTIYDDEYCCTNTQLVFMGHVDTSNCNGLVNIYGGDDKFEFTV